MARFGWNFDYRWCNHGRCVLKYNRLFGGDLMRIKLTLSYDGTAYCGWQVQPNGITVQEVVENAVRSVTGEKVRVTGSGRTDAGVHAQGQVAHFDTESTVPPHKFYKALNAYLPQDVKILKSEQIADTHNLDKSQKHHDE